MKASSLIRCGLIALILLVAPPVFAQSKATARLPLDGEINDRLIGERLVSQARDWLDSGHATPSADIVAQLDRKTCPLKLPKPGNKNLSAVEIAERSRAGVVVLAQLYKCDHCPRWHCNTASGFMLTSDGAFCTSYHAVTNESTATLIILTGDGRLAPVREALAADRASDLVILRAEGDEYTALPLSTNAPVGSTVRVLSHPNRRFFTLSEGIVSRYFTLWRSRARVSMLSITADFAKGSSGAPVLNESGAVIGSVNNTFSSYYDTDEDGHKDNLQMVFKNCVSARHILDLVRRP